MTTVERAVTTSQSDEDEGGTTRSRSISSSSASVSAVGGASTSPSSSTTSNKFLLPIPTPSTNRSQSSFALSEVGSGGDGDVMLEDLPAEIADADMSIAADGSFVETTSGPAARELKRRYDKLYGVNKDLRSPYIITAMINQHGKQVFRVGLRAQTDHPHSQPDYDLLYSNHTNNSNNNSITSADTSLSTHTPSQSHNKRRSRLSGLLLAPSNSSKNSSNVTVTGNAAYGYGYSFGYPTSNNPSSTTNNESRIQNNNHITNNNINKKSFSPPRMLRKTHSIPELSYTTGGGNFYSGDQHANQRQYMDTQGTPGTQVLNVDGNGVGTGTIATGTGRTHSHSVTAADLGRFDVPAKYVTSVAVNVKNRTGNRGDVFSRALGWVSGSGSATSSPFLPASVPSSISASLSLSSQNQATREKHDMNASKQKSVLIKTMKDPFGRGVVFDRVSFSPSSGARGAIGVGELVLSGVVEDDGGASGPDTNIGTAINININSDTGLDVNKDAVGSNYTSIPFPGHTSGLGSGSPSQLDLETTTPGLVLDSQTESESILGTVVPNSTRLMAKSMPESILSPLSVRQMRSFESGDTARQVGAMGATDTNIKPNASSIVLKSIHSNSNSDSFSSINPNANASAGSRRDTMESYLSVETIKSVGSNVSNESDISGGSSASVRSVKSAVRVSVSPLLEEETVQDDGERLLIGEKEKEGFGIESLNDTQSQRSRTPQSQILSHSRQSQLQSQQQPIGPNYHTCGYTRYQTGVFDVLQHYRGLPVLESLDDGVGGDGDGEGDKAGTTENERNSGNARVNGKDIIGPPTVKMSLRSVDEPTPLDDPRFVIWGEVGLAGVSGTVALSAGAENEGGVSTGIGGEEVGAIRKKSVKDKDRSDGFASGVGGGNGSMNGGSATDTVTTTDEDPDSNSPKRVLLAATIERWMAQLTSQLNHSELLTFFLTYRTYISPIDLCQLLIARFHWSLEVSDSMSPEDILCKRLARVRTSTAMRFWLTTFFRVDFLYDRSLRILFAAWVNAIWRDEILQRLPDALLIVKKIRKVVKECKEAHISRSRYARKNSVVASPPARTPVSPRQIDEVIDISREAMASLPPLPPNSVIPPPRRYQHSSSSPSKKSYMAGSAAARADGDDSDVDLDFDPEENLVLLDCPGDLMFSTSNIINGVANGANGNVNNINGMPRNVVANANAHYTHSTSIQSNASTAARIMLQQPLHMTILQHARIGTSDADADARLLARSRVGAGGASLGFGPGSGLGLGPGHGTLPVHNHSTLSRVVVNTIGKLGRWRRVLSSRTLGVGAHGSVMDQRSGFGAFGISGGNGFGSGLNPIGVGGDDSFSYTYDGETGGDNANKSVSALDLELNATGDLLNVKGGVERYLKAIEPIEPVVGGGSHGSIKSTMNTVAEVGSGESLSGQELTNSNSPPSYSAIVAALEAVDSTPPSITIENAGTNLQDINKDNTVVADDLSSSVGVAMAITDTDSVPVGVNTAPNEENIIEDSPSTQEESSPTTPLDEPKLSVDGIAPPRADSAASMRSQRSWHPAIVSIDDLDSDEASSDEDTNLSGPPGLKKPTRRLPLRKDFEFLRRSMDSVSSMSIMTRPSLAAHQSVSEQSSNTSSVSSHRGLGDGLQQWQVDALVNDLSDDDDAPGDVEAALRRLEGQINQQKQQAKERKVNGWVKTIQQRMAKGDFGDQPPTFPEVDSDDDYGTDAHSRDFDEDGKDGMFFTPRETAPTVVANNTVAESERVSQEAITPTPQQATHHVVETSPAASANYTVTSTSNFVSVSTPSSMEEERRSADHLSSTSVEASHAQPQTIPQLPPLSQFARHAVATVGVPTSVSTSSNAQNVNAANVRRDIANFITSGAPSSHRSFILGYRSENIAQHLGMIDRDIFLAIKPQELVSEEWITPAEDTNVLDWNQYMWDNRKRSAGVNDGGRGKISALVAARARFNLVAKFTASEIVLSHPHERIPVVNKFIRIAWKAYLQNNFAALVALIAGLSSDWVRRALSRSRGRIGIWEMRVLEDLRAFASNDDDFLYIRQAIAAISDAEHLSGVIPDDMTTSTGAVDGVSTTSGGVSGRGNRPTVPPTCIPFFGVYLSQLYRLSKLPDLIDPSEPTRLVETDPATGNFKAPAHPEVFATLRPLPSFMQLEPLINVQKQRLIASVIQSLVTGQHIANKVSFPIDRKLLQRCLKLRAVDFDALQTVT